MTNPPATVFGEYFNRVRAWPSQQLLYSELVQPAVIFLSVRWKVPSRKDGSDKTASLFKNSQAKVGFGCGQNPKLRRAGNSNAQTTAAALSKPDKLNSKLIPVGRSM